jgi:hypothetical protein
MAGKTHYDGREGVKRGCERSYALNRTIEICRYFRPNESKNKEIPPLYSLKFPLFSLSFNFSSFSTDKAGRTLYARLKTTPTFRYPYDRRDIAGLPRIPPPGRR